MLKKASLLIFAIWVLVFFSLLNAGLYKIASAQIRLARALQGRLISPSLAKAAYFHARDNRALDVTEYDTLYELRGEQEKLGEGAYSYKLIGEEGKININVVSKDILKRLPGLDEDIAAAVVSSPLYPFKFKEEMRLVNGIDKEKFEALKEFITIYGKGAVNINTAEQEVFEFLDMPQGLIRNIKCFRAGLDGIEGTDDDGFFETTDSIIDKLRAFRSLFFEEQIVLFELINRNLIGVSCDNFSLYVNTEVLDKPSAEYIIVMGEEGIKEWREY